MRERERERKDDWADSFDATFFRFHTRYQATRAKRIGYELRRTGDLGQADGNWYWSYFFPRLNECAKLEGGSNVWSGDSVPRVSFPSLTLHKRFVPRDIRAERTRAILRIREYSFY